MPRVGCARAAARGRAGHHVQVRVVAIGFIAHLVVRQRGERVALQIAFYIGEDQDPQYLKWLFAQFASDSGGCSADDHDAAKLTAGLSGDSHMAEASESGVVTSASDRDSDEDHWQVCQVCEGQGHY